MQHETNTFAPSKADYTAFEAGGGWPSVQYGDPLFDAVAGANIPAQGAIEALRSSGHSLVATAWASASPSAHVTSDAFDRIVGELVGLLEQEPELDPRGAGGLARPAADAVVHRFGERGVVGRHLPAIHRAHESDPAAGVGALEGGQRERGTGRQAEPALDATCEPVAVHLEERPARGGCRRRNAQAVASA